MIRGDCPVCHGLGWVCENHPKLSWDEKGCECGAGMPCKCQRPSLEEPDTSTVISRSERL